MAFTVYFTIEFTKIIPIWVIKEEQKFISELFIRIGSIQTSKQIQKHSAVRQFGTVGSVQKSGVGNVTTFEQRQVSYAPSQQVREAPPGGFVVVTGKEFGTDGWTEEVAKRNIENLRHSQVSVTKVQQMTPMQMTADRSMAVTATDRSTQGDVNRKDSHFGHSQVSITKVQQAQTPTQVTSSKFMVVTAKTFGTEFQQATGENLTDWAYGQIGATTVQQANEVPSREFAVALAKEFASEGLSKQVDGDNFTLQEDTADGCILSRQLEIKSEEPSVTLVKYSREFSIEDQQKRRQSVKESQTTAVQEIPQLSQSSADVSTSTISATSLEFRTRGDLATPTVSPEVPPPTVEVTKKPSRKVEIPKLFAGEIATTQTSAPSKSKYVKKVTQQKKPAQEESTVVSVQEPSKPPVPKFMTAVDSVSPETSQEVKVSGTSIEQRSSIDISVPEVQSKESTQDIAIQTSTTTESSHLVTENVQEQATVNDYNINQDFDLGSSIQKDVTETLKEFTIQEETSVDTSVDTSQEFVIQGAVQEETLVDTSQDFVSQEDFSVDTSQEFVIQEDFSVDTSQDFVIQEDFSVDTSQDFVIQEDFSVDTSQEFVIQGLVQEEASMDTSQDFVIQEDFSVDTSQDFVIQEDFSVDTSQDFVIQEDFSVDTSQDFVIQEDFSVDTSQEFVIQQSVEEESSLEATGGFTIGSSTVQETETSINLQQTTVESTQEDSSSNFVLRDVLSVDSGVSSIHEGGAKILAGKDMQTEEKSKRISLQLNKFEQVTEDNLPVSPRRQSQDSPRSPPPVMPKPGKAPPANSNVDLETQEHVATEEFGEINETSIPGIQAIPDGTPTWKVAMIERKNQELIEKYKNDIAEKQASEDRWKGIPEWKRKMMEEKEKKKHVEEAPLKELERKKQEEQAKLAGMPSWKRELLTKK